MPEFSPRPDLSGEQFLHQKNPKLHLSQPVEHEAYRQEMAGETVSPKPADKIAEWLEVIEHTHTEHQEDPRVAQRLKRYYHDRYVIKPENVPESAFLLEQRIARNDGHGTVEITDNFREQKTQQIIGKQEKSLDKWFDYLTSADADYPMWAKYWAFTSMLQMGALVKEEEGEGDQKKEFAHYNKRDTEKSTTTASFPTLNPRALAMTISVMTSRIEQIHKPRGERDAIANISTKLDNPAFQQLLSTENFSKLYTQFLIEMPEYSIEGLRETSGEWVKYEKDSDPTTLVRSLDGYPLEWCTADFDVAQSQLQGGDFYVYYSINEAGEAKIPRLAIRMQGNKIGENPRGIAPNQNLDPYIGDVLEKKLNEFPDKAEFQKKSADMKKLTQIEEKSNRKEELNSDNLRFLYEIDGKIQGFGYEDDPRIKELRATRDSKADAAIVLECRPEEIAWNQGEISENTKSYIGHLFTNIFQLNLEHIYTSFPETETRQDDLKVGGDTAPELQGKLDKLCRRATGEINISDSAQDKLKEIYQTTEFAQLAQNPEIIRTVRLKVRDLGFTTDPTTDQIYARAQELGLELCPDEVVPYQRLKDADQPMGTYYYIAMKQFADRDGRPNVFGLSHNDVGLLLGSTWARSDSEWDLGNGLMFRLRNVSQKTSNEEN